MRKLWVFMDQPQIIIAFILRIMVYIHSEKETGKPIKMKKNR